MDGWMDGWMDGFSMRGRSMRANDGMMAIDGRWMVDASTARSIVGGRRSSSVVGRRRARDVGRGLACEDTDRHACPAGCDRWMVWVHIGCDVKV